MRSPLAPLIPVLLPLPFSIALRLSDLLCGVLSDCVDVLDECDEVLRHKYQLIYAVGDRTPLPSGDLRWAAVQALCRVIKHHGGGRETALASVLADADVAVWEEGGHKPEAFNRLRLLRGEAMQTALPTLHMALAEALLDEPPYELRWLKEKGQKGNGSLRGAILRYITDAASLEDKGGLERELGEKSREVQSLLVLRGLLGFGIFAHALQMRPRVEYGINERGLKRLAVPYRAADTPSERAEYGHPDVALCCTVLSYYYDGLSATQTMEAFTQLLEQGPSAQVRDRNMPPKYPRILCRVSLACLSTGLLCSACSCYQSLWHAGGPLRRMVCAEPAPDGAGLRRGSGQREEARLEQRSAGRAACYLLSA